MGGWRRSLGTHGRTGTILKNQADGDITPVSRIAHWLLAMEAMTGLLYVAVLIARLVSLYSRTKSENS